MNSHKQIIDEIRRRRFRIGLDLNDVPPDIREHIEEQDRYRRDAARLAADIYSESPHFLLELIQNAEDNRYKTGAVPTLTLSLRRDIILIQNNEMGFTRDNVDAICAIGKSTKSKTLGYIGEKGIGFKSVFLITDSPSVYSAGFRFRFNYDQDDPVSLIVPDWIDAVPDYVNPSLTNIVLPLKKSLIGRAREIAELDSTLLLFLKKLRRIRLVGSACKSKEVFERYSVGDRAELIHSARGETKRTYWKLVRREIQVRGIKEKKRRDITRTEIILAFPLRPDGTASAGINQSVFAFLPVRPYGFRFIIQADFLLPANREDISKTSQWNARLIRDNICKVFMDAIDEFKKDDKLASTYYNYIPTRKTVNDPFFFPVVTAIQSRLSEAHCILSDSGRWRKPSDVLEADQKIRRVITNEDLKLILGKEFISPKVRMRSDVREALSIQKFEFKHLLACLRNTEWLGKHSAEWFTGLYTHLASHNQRDTDRLKRLKIIRLESGEIVSAGTDGIFLPISGKRNYGFEKDMRFVSRTITAGPATRKEHYLKAAEFLKRLGVRTPRAFEIIENHILPIYESENEITNWVSRPADVLMAHIKYIKDNLNRYQNHGAHAEGPSTDGPASGGCLRRLRECIQIKSNLTADGGDSYGTPKDLYIPNAYGTMIDLEYLLRDIKDAAFVSTDYISKGSGSPTKAGGRGKKKRRRISAAIADWRDFFLKIGVNEGLRVVEAEGRHLSEEVRSSLRNGRRCTAEEIFDWSLEYLPQVLSSIERRKDRKLIRLLLTALMQQLQELRGKTLLTYKWRYHSWYTVYAPATWIKLLRTSNWLPTTAKRLMAPTEIFIKKPDVVNLLGKRVPYLRMRIESEEIIELLGINTAATTDGILGILRRMITEKATNRAGFERLYEELYRAHVRGGRALSETFANEPLIYIPKSRRGYYTSGDVFWSGVSATFGDYWRSLQGVYPGLKQLFTGKLDIRERPDPKDFAELLVEISEKNKLSKRDEKVVLGIYEVLNRYLEDNNTENQISEAYWWRKFLRRAIWWTDKNEFWSNDGDIFVSDNNDLYNLFKDSDKLAFLKLPRDYYPRIGSLLRELDIPLLSKCIKITLSKSKRPVTDRQLTELIRGYFEPVSRYLYHRAYADFNRITETGFLNSLKKIKVQRVKTLKAKCRLNGVSVPTERKMLFHGGRLLLQHDQEADMDAIAVELAKAFGEIPGFEDFMITLFSRRTPHEVNALLRAKGIGHLSNRREDGNLAGRTADLDDEAGEAAYGLLEVHEQRDLAEPQLAEHPIVPTSTKWVQSTSVPGSRSTESGGALIRTWSPDLPPAKVKIRYKTLRSVSPARRTGRSQKKRSGGKSGGSKPQPTETQSPLERRAIGRWGEEYAWEVLRSRLLSRYAEGQIERTKSEMLIRQKGAISCKAVWLNSEEDRGEGYDIEVTRNGVTDYIEVKSTKTKEKETFEVTRRQWELAKESGDRFHIYRVYGAGTEDAELVDIANPVKAFEEGRLAGYPMRLEI